MPSNANPSKPQKYLIETNPVLTELKQFMSSDYLLANLGYNPDDSAKHLGDGLYEQRLIQQAVLARTGQRYIDGQTTDEGLLKYLMNNAVASKEALNLSMGVTAGAISYVDSNWFQAPSGATNGGSTVTSAGPIQNPGYSKDMLSWANAQQTVLRSGTHALINSGVTTAINGGSFGKNLGGALFGEGLDLAKWP